VTTPVSRTFGQSIREGTPIFFSHMLIAAADHVFTTRQLRFRGDDIEADFDRIGLLLGCSNRDIVRLRQVHGREIAIVRPGDDTDEVPDADAAISLDPERAVAVRVADCVPILIADRAGHIVAAVHAGWRGTAAGISTAVVQAFRELGASSGELMAAIGPCIGPCCYQIDAPVFDAMHELHPEAGRWFTADGDHRWKLDLVRANVDQLTAAGIPAASIDVAGICTSHRSDVCYSHRAEGADTGRMAAVIRARPVPA
jgi:YfiH family protein